MLIWISTTYQQIHRNFTECMSSRYIIFHTMQYWVLKVLQRYFHLLFMAHLKLHVPAIGLKRAFLLNSFWVEPHGKFTSRSRRTSAVPCRPICPVEPISVREQCINLFPSNSDWNFKHFRTSIWTAEFTSIGSVTKWPRQLKLFF